MDDDIVWTEWKHSEVKFKELYDNKFAKPYGYISTADVA
jgi:hypothetical protein